MEKKSLEESERAALVDLVGVCEQMADELEGRALWGIPVVDTADDIESGIVKNVTIIFTAREMGVYEDLINRLDEVTVRIVEAYGQCIVVQEMLP